MAAKRCQATKRQRSGQHQRSLSKPKLEKSALSLSEVSRAYRRHHLKGERKKLQGLHLDDQLGERTTAAAGGRQQTWGCPRGRLPLSPPLTASSVFSLQQQTRLLEEGVRRRKRRTRKPSKYTCRFSSRACVRCGFLQKRICSHARERPLRSCSPCESRFESKSNLREHRKSRIRRPELGLSDTAVDHSGVQAWQLMENQKGFMEASSLGSEYKPKQLGFLPSALEEPAERALQKSSSIAPSRAADAQGLMDSQRTEEAHAVKQRLVMRLSERKRTPVDASDEGLACADPWSKGSTESGYFSRSESSELPQTSPPNSEAKSYAEIILGKFGRVDQGPRNAHQQCHRCSEPERRRIPLNVPATQVIEHITKLITINEALVDTREIDSVKPRRSLSRKNSLELPRALKAPCAYHPKGDTPGSGSASSVDVKCLRNNLHPRFLNADSRPRRASPVPLLRSRSMPSSASAAQPPTPRFRSSHSFDERQAAPAGKRAGHHHGMLRRQRALEAPFEPDIVLQGMAPYYSSATTVLCGPWQPTTRDSCPREPESCIPCFGNRSVPEEHVLSSEVLPAEDAKRKACNEYYSRALPDVLCKKQKEDGKELEECLSNARLVLSSLSPTSSFKIERNATFEKLSSKANVMLLRSDGRSIGKGISVIQHTSSFERSGKTAAALTSDRGHQPPPIELPQPPSSCHLMRQHSIEVPEVLLAEDADSNIASGTSLESLAVTHAKESEKFQYPQRSVTLAQLPAEKLPPKKKRLCLNDPQTSEVPGAQREFFNYRCLPSQGYSAAYEGGHIYPLGKQATFGACDKKVLPSGTGEIILPAKSNVNPVSPREPNRPTLSAELSQNEPPLRLSPVSPPPPDALAQPRTGSILSVSSTQRVLSVSQCPVPSLVSLTTRSVVPLRHRVFPFQPVRDLGESGAALGSPDPTSLRPAADVHRQDTKSSPPPSLSLIPILCVDQHACPTDLPSSELSTHLNPTTIPVRTQNAFPLYGKGLYTSQSVGVVQKNQGCLQIKLEEQSHLNPCVEPCISGIRDNLSWTPPLKPSAPLEREVTGSRSKKRALSQAGSVEFFPDKEPQPKRVKNEDEGNDDCVGKRPIEEGESKQDKVIKEPTLMCERKKEEKTQKVKLNEHTESEFRESEPSKENGHKNNHLRTMDSSHTNETLNSCISTATMVSWCYLKYLNPSCNRDLQNPGCSSWSSYLPSPNLPGFSTRLALSLLCSKQKQRPEVYTVASMIQPAAEQLVPATKTQRSEVQGSATMSSSSAVVRECAEETEERSSENEATST